jgi:hypothetical protein
MAKPTNDPITYLAAGVQSAVNVDATSFYFFKHLDGSGHEPEADIQSEREGGDGQESGLRYIQKNVSDGAVNVNGRPGAMGRLWAWALGQASVAEITPSTALIKEHTAFSGASQPLLTFEQRAPDDLIERTTNNIITNLEETWEAGNPLKLTAQYMSGGSLGRRSTASALTPTRETTLPIQYPGASVSLTVNDSAGGAAATTIKITKGKITVKRGVDDSLQTTGLNRDDILGLTFDIDFEGTARYESLELYRNVYMGAGTTMLTEVATGTFNLFSARGSFSHRVNIPVMNITAAKVNRLDPDGKTTFVDFVGASIKNATNSIFAVTRSGDASGYLAP